MAIVQPVKDGKVVDTSASSQSLSTVRESSNSSLDKEAFLQLLVAQMKYQDPLEPTSNTEYISQLATFSSLEEMQNLNSTMEANQATNLVGKTVIMKVTSSSGETSYVTGVVDYIVRENGNTYLSIENDLYSLDDLDSVVDSDYMEATNIAEDFEAVVSALPSANRLLLSDFDKLNTIATAYDSLTDYQKAFIEKYKPDALAKLKELVAKMKELMADEEDTTGDTDGVDGTEGTDTDDTDDTDSSTNTDGSSDGE